MANIKTLDKVYQALKKENIANSNKLVVSPYIILNYLRQYEYGFPDGICPDHIQNVETWLNNEIKKGHLAFSYANNTYNLNSHVTYDFGFAVFESLVDDATYVMLIFHGGNCFFREVENEKYYPILLKFDAETTFYDILDNIILESDNIPYEEIAVNGQHYLILPKITSDNYFVFDKDSQEMLEIDGCSIEEVINNISNMKTKILKE